MWNSIFTVWVLLAFINWKIVCIPTFTFTKLSSVKFVSKEISNIIRLLDINKAHGNDISVRMLKIWDSAIVEPLTIIFNSFTDQSTFPDIWKKSNICPIHEKGDKQTINNYQPVSLLPVCGKIFERLIFNSWYKYLEDNKSIISPSIWLSIRWFLCKSLFVNCT